jgi:16S rRNA U516 pseudouridylate synthase RsuA-like enzyme
LSAASRRSDSGARSVPLTREALAKLKLKALRRGIWFRDLKQSERKLLSLTIRVVQRVRSFILARLVSRIVGKLCEAMESRVHRLMRTEGRNLAEKLSRIGQVWGNRSARSWATDQGFIQYLTVNNLSPFGNV